MIDFILFWLYRLRGKYRYSWKELEVDVYWIANWAMNRGFKEVYGVPNGGLIIAVLFKKRYEGEIRLILLKSEVTKDTLVLDDVCHSGDTIGKLEAEWAQRGFTPQFATPFYKEGASRKPDYFRRKVKKKLWIVFPWETMNNSKYDHTEIS